jgi:SARP family transcriptional regulator, regulator of embCAB operon
MLDDGGCRLQVCGPLFACVRGEDVTHRIPAGQARTLFVQLVLNRDLAQSRSELLDALWPGEPPPAAERALAALLSRLRAVVGSQVLPIAPDIRLRLPDYSEVDLEVAESSMQRAEAALAAEDWRSAWTGAGIAMSTARRGFLPGVHLPWVERKRGEIRDLRLRACEVFGTAVLGLGGPELAGAERAASEIIDAEPLRESGYRLAMRSCVARGNPAEALRIYARMRRRLADELGVDPGPESRALFDQILAASSRA